MPEKLGPRLRYKAFLNSSEWFAMGGKTTTFFELRFDQRWQKPCAVGYEKRGAKRPEPCGPCGENEGVVVGLW